MVGHEVGHAFDDAGSTYDEAGNLNENFFAAADRAAFRKRVGCFESLYQNVSIAAGVTVLFDYLIKVPLTRLPICQTFTR